MHIGVITNPNSRKNRGRPDRAAELQSIVGDLGEVHQTTTVESIKPILREFLRKRARFWVADGGDGAMHCMVRAGMEVLEEEEFAGRDLPFPLTLPTNGGTIDFIAHNAGVRGSAERLLSLLRRSIEEGVRVEEALVDSMRIEGTQVVSGREEPFRTYGFACAAGGVGQRFFAKYYEDEDPTARTIVKVVAKSMASLPVAYSPLRSLPGIPRRLREYARDVFAPTSARVTLDGMVLPENKFTGIHIGSMSINLGNVLRLFGKAENPGLMHAIVASASALGIVRNLPRMHMGWEMRGRAVIDRACRGMTVEAIGSELLDPVIDGEYYRNVRKIYFQLGPRLRIPKLAAAA